MGAWKDLKACNVKLDKAVLKKKGHFTIILGLGKDLKTPVGIFVLVNKVTGDKLGKKENQHCQYQPEVWSSSSELT